MQWKNMLLHISSHIWPIEVVGEHQVGLLYSEMSHQTIAMRFMQKRQING
jgi:hypothetical protein